MTRFIFIITLFIGIPIANAAPPIKSLEDLKAIQKQATQTVKKVLPTTISLFSPKNGASGSGVIVSEDGLILTAGHVVRGAEEITVVFPNGKQARGKVLGANYTRDSAMVKIIDPGPWPYAEIGTSKNLKSGDLVLALGHAGGYDPIRTPPVRFGRIISRSINQFISSDCTLIGGDSGGPLFDMDGKVVGIHSSIGKSLASNNHASIEGFLQDWDRLKKGETWGRLGGSALDDPNTPVLGIMTAESARNGVGVSQVLPGGPAQQAGLQDKDIIHSINGDPTPNLRRLHSVLTKYKPGNTVTLSITRNNKKMSVKIKLGRRGDILK